MNLFCRFYSSTRTRFAFDRISEICTQCFSYSHTIKWHVVARRELAFLLLGQGVIEMHVLPDGGHILMTQQFLEGENVAAEHQKADCECMTEGA